MSAGDDPAAATGHPFPALFSDLDGEAGGRRAATAVPTVPAEPSPELFVADEEGSDDVPAFSSATAGVDDDHDQERGGGAAAVEPMTSAGPLHVRPPVAEPVDVVRAAEAPVLEQPRSRPVVGRRPLGTDLLAAVRTAAPARPVAGFVPAALAEPVSSPDAVDRRAPAPVRPELPQPAGGRPMSGFGPSDERPAYDVGDQRPSDEPGAGVGSTAVELPPGLPDWWPAESETWSVRDADPFQAPPSAATAVDDTAAADQRPTPADEGPVLRQRIRPTRDPASGAPVTRRVPFPGTAAGEGPALRQVRRPRHVETEPVGNVLLDPHLPLPDVLPGTDDPQPATSGLPAATDPGPATTPAAPASAAAAAPAAAGLSPEDVADHVRHALLVERERSGALADQW